jgi:hypothetical protein
VGRTVPADPRPGRRVRVRLRTAAGTALAPSTPVALALYRRTGTPGQDLASPLGRRVARSARGPAGRVTLKLPPSVRPSALWLLATTRTGVALIPIPSPNP